MKFELASLPYGINSFEPYISGKTFEYHHGKLQKDYVAALNRIIPGTEYIDSDLVTIIKKASGAIYTNATRVWNHSFYFDGLKPGYNGQPKESFAEIVKNNFGSIPLFRKAFINTAHSLSVSGWIWLVVNQKGAMEIIEENQAGNPLRNGSIPLLNCDLWEHAYYFDYQNRRLDYVNSFLGLINWDLVEKRYKDAI
jgi:Fe-Mn family superoxide dismutase